jgi:hypothetical protein
VRVRLGLDVTNHSLVTVLLLAEDQSGYVASIFSRRAELPGPMWDLDNTALSGRVPHSFDIQRSGGTRSATVMPRLSKKYDKASGIAKRNASRRY